MQQLVDGICCEVPALFVELCWFCFETSTAQGALTFQKGPAQTQKYNSPTVAVRHKHSTQTESLRDALELPQPGSSLQDKLSKAWCMTADLPLDWGGSLITMTRAEIYYLLRGIAMAVSFVLGIVLGLGHTYIQMESDYGCIFRPGHCFGLGTYVHPDGVGLHASP